MTTGDPVRISASEARKPIAKHRRQIELSPGVGVDAQRYALAACDDILADLEIEAAQQGKEYPPLTRAIIYLTDRA